MVLPMGWIQEMLLKRLGKHVWMLQLMLDFHQICVRHVLMLEHKHLMMLWQMECHLKTVWHKRCKVGCKLGKIILMVQICQILML